MVSVLGGRVNVLWRVSRLTFVESCACRMKPRVLHVLDEISGVCHCVMRGAGGFQRVTYMNVSHVSDSVLHLRQFSDIRVSETVRQYFCVGGSKLISVWLHCCTVDLLPFHQ